MAFPLVLVIGIALFALQMALCFCARRKWLRLLPTVAVCLGEAVSWAVFFLTRDSPLDIVLGVYILAVIGLVWLGTLALAWVIYAVAAWIKGRAAAAA